MLGAFGVAILFFFAAAGVAIVGLFYLAYAAHCFLVVLESTAAGDDEVVWPDEPMLDWLWKLLYLAGLVSLWLVPVSLFAEVVLGQSLGGSVPSFLIAFVGVVWLLLPVSVLSSLSATNRWIILRPALLWELARQGGAMAVYYGVSGLLMLGAAALVYYAVFRQPALAPVAAGTVAAVLLVNARLLGRVARLVSYRPAPPAGRAGKGKKRKRRPASVPALAPGRAAPLDPPTAEPTPSHEKPSISGQPNSAEEWFPFMPPEQPDKAEPVSLPATPPLPTPVRSPEPARRRGPVHYPPLPVPEDLEPPESQPHRPQASVPLMPEGVEEIGLVPLEPRASRFAEDAEEWHTPLPYGLSREVPTPASNPRPERREPIAPFALQTHEAERTVTPRSEPAPPAPDNYPRPELGPVLPKPASEGNAERTPLHDVTRVSPFEEALERRSKPPPLPPYPLWLGVYTFPWYPTSLRAWIYLSLIGLVLCGLLLVLRLTWLLG
jgi:hypothetical protein